MNILIGCEESQVVATAFRKNGHTAFSCDLLLCSGGHPEYHLQRDVFETIENTPKCHECGKPCIIDYNSYRCDFCNRLWPLTYEYERVIWDKAIFHPECTRLTVTANKWYKPEYANRFPNIHVERERAKDFFMKLTKTNIPQTAIENPIGIMSTFYRKPDQIIHPYHFGDPQRKSTCLWLKNLPKLVPTNIVEPKIITFKSGKTMSECHFKSVGLSKEERRKFRSVTFPGIARAMADQWG